VTTAVAWGEDFESLIEDLIVFAAAWHGWLLAQNFIRHKRTAGKSWRLNGWQRVGVVVSVLWALYGFYQGNEYGLHQGDWAVYVQKSCWAEPAPNLSLCDAQFTRNWEAAIQHHWEYAFIYSLVPIPLGWLSVYGLLQLIRWVKRGFTPPAQAP
jgi:hypothetical protein